MRIPALAAALALLAVAAAAQEKPRNYLELRAGHYWPAGDLKQASFESKTGPIDVVFGRRLLPQVAVEGSVGYLHSERHYTSTLYSENDLLNVVPLRVGVKGFEAVGPVELFAGGALGLDVASLKSDQKIAGKGGTLTGTSAAAAFQVSGGATYDVTPSLFAGAEAGYTLTDNATYTGTVAGASERLSFNMNRWWLAALIGFRL